MSGTNALGRVLSGSSGRDGEERKEESKRDTPPPSTDGAAPPDSVAATYGDQDIWQELSSRTTREVAGMMSCGFDFPQILDFMRDQRKAIAIEQRTNDADDFGRPRVNWKAAMAYEHPEDADIYIQHYLQEYGEDGAKIYRSEKTPMAGRYLAAGTACREAFESGSMPKGDFEPCSFDGALVSIPQVKWPSDTTLEGYRCMGRIGEESVPLTAAVFAPRAAAAGPSKPGGEAAGIWLHTSPDAIPKILEHVTALQAELLPQTLDKHDCVVAVENTDPAGAVSLIARIAWWLCHAMPQVRGSASVIEWYVEAALKQCKLDLGKRIEALDLAAFRMSEADFAKNFCDMFKSDLEFTAPPADTAASPSPGASEPSDAMKRELAALRLLRQNNCLIDAIAGAAGLGAPTEAQLITIRGRLNNIGQMMVAAPGTIGVIRDVLGITRPVTVRYPDPIPAETFPGTGEPIYVRHTGAAHFVADPA